MKRNELISILKKAADLFIDFGCSHEGQIAGAFILTKAGGLVMNYDGAEFDHHQVGIVASNGSVLQSHCICQTTLERSNQQ